MDSVEISEEMAFDSVFLEDGWYHHAQLCASVYNAPGLRKKPIQPDVFLPKLKKLKQMDVRSKFRAFAEQHNAIRSEMATLKTLSLNIATDVGQLSAGLAKGGKMVESFNAQVMKSFASVSAKMGGHFTDMFKFDAGAILSKITSFATSGMDAIDQLGDTAQSLGMTTAALSELRYAAKLAGSDAESLDMALTKLSANLGDAVQ
jgi:hypothetical protein